MLVPRKVYRVIQAVTVLSPRFRSLIFTFKRVTWSFQKKVTKNCQVFFFPVQAFQLAFFSWGKNLLKFDERYFKHGLKPHACSPKAAAWGMNSREWGMELDLLCRRSTPQISHLCQSNLYATHLICRWCFQIMFIFTPIWGRWTHFDEYFSDGLKPSRWVPPYLPLPSWHMSMVRLLDTSSPCPIQQKTSIGVLGWVVKGDPSCFQWFPKTLEGKLYPTREDFQVGEHSWDEFSTANWINVRCWKWFWYICEMNVL